MSWIQISVKTQKLDADSVETLLLEHGACSVTLSDASDEPILEPAPGETPLWNDAVVTGLFEHSPELEAIKTGLNNRVAGLAEKLRVNTLPDQDWTRAWMDNYRAMRFGERLWVCPWHLEPPDADAVNLRLDPGLAFGTGTHPTTSLCLSWLDQHIRQQQRLLDYGCGSGILAIAALLLGVEQADGVDIDPQALEASRANAIANKVDSRLTLYSADQASRQSYDIVVANILSGPLTELAATLAQHTLAGGDIVLSGILEEQADSVRSAYAKHFDMDTHQVEGDWVLLHGCRKA